MPHRFFLLLLIGLLGGSSAKAQTPASILVVPFENANSEARYHWLSEASAVLLADGLRERGLDAITRPERVNAFEQLHLPVAASLSRATVIKVGQLLGAREVIVGTFTVQSDKLTVSAQVISVDVGRVQSPASERGELTDLFAVYERLARRIARDAPLVSGTRAPYPPLDAFESFIKGLLAENPSTRAAFLEAAIRENSEFDRARLALWEVRADQGDHQSALATVKAVKNSSSYSRRGRFAAGVSLMELKRYDEAFDTFKQLLDEKTTDGPTSNAAVLNNLGVVQIRRGATSQAGTSTYYLTKAVDADTDPDYLFNLGYAYVLERNYQGALYWLREALRRDPTDADAHFILAAALQATGGSVEAARERDLARQLSARYEELDKAGAERSSVPPALERVALELDAARALRADQAIVGSTQREHGELARFHLDTGRRLFEKEQDREAMAELRRAVYLSPYQAEAHLLIGRIHLRGGQPGDAIEALKISIWSEETAAARLALAEAYLKAGNTSAARTEVTRALAIDPDSADAKRLLATIK
jgi:Tfp pilus assembly protein PilF/TolB-like protein